MANTLYDYYKGQGQALPGVSDRAKLYETAGLGTGYQGTAQQNTALLGYLQKPTGNTAPLPEVAPANVPVVNPAKPNQVAVSGIRIADEADLQTKRDELTKAGIAQNEWTKYITNTGGKLSYSPPATFTKDGQTKTVATGSNEANSLLNSGWTLGGSVNDSTVNSDLLDDTTKIDIGNGDKSDTSDADVMTASAKAYKEAMEALNNPPETAESKKYAELLAKAGIQAGDLTGQGATQISAEEQAGIQAKKDIVATTNTQLNVKLAEINALDNSYRNANAAEAGKGLLTSIVAGRQSNLEKQYIAKKNVLAGEAGILQAQLLGLQGELKTAQDAVDRAVDLMYKDRQSAFNASIAQLELLQPQIDKKNSQYADNVKLMLQQKLADVAEEKQTTKDIQNLKLEAIKAGITDSNVLSRIGSAKTVNDAMQILGVNMPKEASKSTWGKIGTKTNEYGELEDVYGFIDTTNQTVTPVTPGSMVTGNTNGKITSPSGNTYDWSTYNAIGTPEENAAYIQSVQDYINGVGKLNNETELQNYINTQMKGSKITSKDIIEVSGQTGVGWEELLGLVKKESMGGASPVALKNNNFGGITASSTYMTNHPNATIGTARPSSEGGNYVKFKTVKDGLLAQAEQFSKRQIQTSEADNDAIVETPKIPIRPAEAAKLNKEIVSSDTYKAIIKGQDSLQFLKNFSDLFEKTGATSAVWSPRQNAELKAKYNASILNLKEFFNLGVLNGPDEAILRSVLPDPTNRSALLTVASGGIYKPYANTKAGIISMRDMINASLDTRFKSLSTQYGDYDLNTMKDLKRIYVDQKKIIDPRVKKMIEENPNLSDDEIIYTINP